MSTPSCQSPAHSSDRPAAAGGNGRQLPVPVAAAWEEAIGAGIGEPEPAATVVPPGPAPGAPPPTLGERLGDFALLGLAAVASGLLMLVVVTHASWQLEVELVAVAMLAGVALVAGHLQMLSRRRARVAAHRAAQERLELTLRAQVADSETRHMRLAAFSELAAQVAHEVRNPLSAIVLNAELLEDELHACIHASPEVKRLARAVSAEAERLTELTNEYLTFARLPQPAATPQPLSPLLDEVAHFSRGEAERAGVRLSLDLDPAATALFDARLVRQLMLNLLRNAIDAMAGGGRLTVRTAVGTGVVLVDVIDSGPGVPPPLRESIFEPFFSTKVHGTGLGLAVARKVARDHGGDLRLMPADAGAWFRLELPAPEGAAAATPPPAPAAVEALA